MNAFAAIVFASLLSRLGYQMARSPVLPAFAADLGALPEFIGVIVAASTFTGVFFKLPSGALSDVLGRKRMMVLGALFFAFATPFGALDRLRVARVDERIVADAAHCHQSVCGHTHGFCERARGYFRDLIATVIGRLV